MSEIKERPLLYSTPMVQATLEGRKTQTRRVVKPQPEQILAQGIVDGRGYGITTERNTISHYCPYGQPGDRLWVRETLIQQGELGLQYVADSEWIDEAIIPVSYGPYGGDYTFRNIPAIHMPRWACRLLLEITAIRVERLQDISEEDAIREGVFWDSESGFWYVGDTLQAQSATEAFMKLWIAINGEESWKANPWVWAIEFRRVEA